MVVGQRRKVVLIQNLLKVISIHIVNNSLCKPTKTALKQCRFCFDFVLVRYNDKLAAIMINEVNDSCFGLKNYCRNW